MTSHRSHNSLTHAQSTKLENWMKKYKSYFWTHDGHYDRSEFTQRRWTHKTVAVYASKLLDFPVTEGNVASIARRIYGKRTLPVIVAREKESFTISKSDLEATIAATVAKVLAERGIA